MPPAQVKRNRESWIEEGLAELDRTHLRRALRVREDDGGRLDLSTNDYLGLSRHPEVVAAARMAAERCGTGAGASRLVAGNLPVYEELEREIARFKGYPAALLFGSGYLTNIGLLQALAGRSDTIFADRLCHASLLEGAHLSNAKLVRFGHNDPDDLRRRLTAQEGKGRALVVTESVFSMDGDLAPLVELAEVAEAHEALFIVDEAHATGVFGPSGSGRVSELGLQAGVNVSMFTLSKALGGYGGGAACSTTIRDWLISRARSFIFTTGLPGSIPAAAIAAIRLLQGNPDWGPTLLARAARFRSRLREGGLDTLQSASPIIPVLIGDEARTLRIAARLRAQDIDVGAIRPPTVPAGTARLRLSIGLQHDDAMLERAAVTILAAVRAESAS